MRLLHLFNDDRHAKTFSSYLTQCEIENKLDLEKNTDWGSSDYGNIVGKVWVIDEDDMEEARKRLNEYLENPNDEKFKYLRPVSFAIISSLEDNPDQEPLSESKDKEKTASTPSKKATRSGWFRHILPNIDMHPNFLCLYVYFPTCRTLPRNHACSPTLFL